MASTFEDSVLDFDINLFQQSSNNALGNKDKVRKAIFLSKRKMMSTDSLIRKYYDKRLGYQALERCLLSSKEEYKQSCIESMEYREKCAALEDEIKKLQVSNKELEEKCIAADNRHDGMKSHAKQLQMLVKEHETLIESLKIEYQLEKENSKELEKKYANIQKENDHLIKNISFIKDNILGKKKITKELKFFLMKYGNSSASHICESEEGSDEADTFDDPMSPLSDSGVCNDRLVLGSPSPENKNTIETKLRSIDINEENIHTRDDNDRESECSNEVVSSDTGRGSSLAFSDSDKCFNSPEYFNDHSPLNAEILRHKDIVIVDVATSPIPLREFANVATSPVLFEKQIFGDREKAADRKTTDNTPIIMIDRVLSPIITTHYVEMSTSPVKNITNDIATSPLKIGNKALDCHSHDSNRNAQEKECLANNNSECLEDENSSDSEIRMILDTMRFNKNLITPIPTTPAKPRSVEVSINNATQTTLHSSVCPDAAKMREENNALQATVAKLAKDILNINIFLNRFNPSIKNDIFIDTRDTPIILNDKYSLEEKERLDLSSRQGEERRLTQNNETSLKVTEVVENKLNFNAKTSKLNKLSLLFADSIPPSPSDELAPLPSSPTAPSPPLSSPSASAIHELVQTNVENSINPIEDSYNLKSKERLHFEDNFLNVNQGSVSDDAVSDHEIYEGEIVVENKLNFNANTSKLNKLSLLFADSIPPSPSDELAPLPSSPTAPSPPLSSPRASPIHELVQTNIENSINPIVDSYNLKSKERLQFEDNFLNVNQGSVSDDAVSDHEIYEGEIVIELTPDSHESDKNSLHEILKEQVLVQQRKDAETLIQKTPKSKKMSTLEKLRKKMVPKCKIKKVDVPVKRKRRIQPKRLTLSKERIECESEIKNKAAYERACKVMSEIKSKEKVNDMALMVPSRLPVSPEKLIKKAIKPTDLPTAHFYSTEKDSHNQLQSQQVNIQKNSHDIVENNRNMLRKSLPQLYKTAKFKNVGSVGTGRCSKNIEEYDTNFATSQMVSTPIETSRDFEDSNLLDHQRTIRTRSQSKSIDHNDDKLSVTQKNSEDRKCILQSDEESDSSHLTSPTLKMYGRNRRKSKGDDNTVKHNNSIRNCLIKPNILTDTEEPNGNSDEVQPEDRKHLKRPSVDKPTPDIAPKRMLRSSTVLTKVLDREPETVLDERVNEFIGMKNKIVSYGDIDIFNDDSPATEKHNKDRVTTKAKFAKRAEHPKFGILCSFLDKYGRNSPKASVLKLSENATNYVSKILINGIGEIQKLPFKDTKLAMDKLVQDLQGQKQKQFLSGLMKYLKEPERKMELYNKVNIHPAPSMTKAEQILIYIVSQFKVCWPDVVDNILKNIEYTLFMLNRTPEFDVVETLSHFYAVLCRYDKNKNRLRLFIIDAMYCLQYKAVPLIRQCLDVWMHILPLAHMGMAKNPMVTCLVYLLHFYKCVDKFNRVQDIRNILHRKYFYEVSEWNETRILEMFRNSIIELRDIGVEKKMLRMALIILAKRHGARWCQNNIVKNILQPIIEEAGVPDRVKQFCVSLLGPLLKPYPLEMKVNCEIIINQLFDMLNRNPSKQMEEAIFTSLIYMSRHNQNRVIKALLFWKPEHISPEFEELLRNYVRERPVKSWRLVLSKISVYET